MGGPQTIEVGEAPVIHIREIQGDLVLRGHGESTVTLISDGVEDFDIGADHAIRFVCTSDCVAHVPATAVVYLGEVHGDAQINGIGGALQIQEIQGDLSINHCGPASIQTIAGDVSANAIAGDLTIVAVEGDASIAHVDGTCNLTGISDDLSLANVRGNINANVGDDASLRVEPRAGLQVRVHAGGDLTCRIPGESDVAVSLECGGDLSVRHLPIDGEQWHRNFTLGSGEANLQLTAGGDLALLGTHADWQQTGPDGGIEVSIRAGELAQQIASQVEAQVTNATRHLDERLSRLATDEDLANRIQDKIQSALRMAEVKISEAVRKAEDRTRQAEQQARGKQQNVAWDWSSTPKPPPAPKAPRPNLSDDERMTILQMVDDGKISVEQAEQLLAALRPK